MVQRREPTTVDRARTFRSIFAEYRGRCISYRTRVRMYGVISKDRDRYDFGKFNFSMLQTRENNPSWVHLANDQFVLRRLISPIPRLPPRKTKNRLDENNVCETDRDIRDG